MIFETLLPHAEALTEDNKVGEDCFVLQSCSFGIEAFREYFESNLTRAKPKLKIELPILFSGTIKKAIPARFQGSNSGNASSNTFKKLKKKESFPNEWFPWLFTERNRIGYNNFLSLLEKFNSALPEDICKLFAVGGPLFTFTPAKKQKPGLEAKDLERMVIKSVYQPVTCNKPTLAVHSVLALNALNEKAELFGEEKDPDLIQGEMFKFCLLFWMLNRSELLKINYNGSDKDIQITHKIVASGNIDDISHLPPQ